ncbi:unnamed protein product [Arabidopsis halleri]
MQTLQLNFLKVSVLFSLCSCHRKPVLHYLFFFHPHLKLMEENIRGHLIDIVQSKKAW